jgi:hypothetical protein
MNLIIRTDCQSFSDGPRAAVFFPPKALVAIA